MPLKRRGPGTRVFYAADLHGSEPAWRKFVNAAAFYDVDVLVFGGDLMGKALVPIVRENGHLRARFQGADHQLEAGSELEAFTRGVELAGFYWRVMGEDDYRELRGDPLALEGLFQDLARERLRAWLAFGSERLSNARARMFMTGGNDDHPAVLSVLDEVDGERIVACEGRVVELDEHHTMITVGLSTPTPWDTPREASEDEIGALIDAGMTNVPDPARCVFNLHVPPKDSALDRCLKLDTEHLEPGELPKPVRVAGRFVTIGGGSSAVREAIGLYQPLVGLHGHIHESPGRVKIGRTQCFNPGSEYGQGQLQGMIMQLRDGKLSGYQHTAG